MSGFDVVSVAIGLILGMIIMLILVWIAYYSRAWMFAYCPTSARICGGADYYNDPGDALAHGADINDILFLNQNRELLYKRVPKTTTCVPGPGQTVTMIYPQYCAFAGVTGSTGAHNLTRGIYRETSFNSNIYLPTNGSISEPVTTAGNCIPNPGYPVTTGIPLIRWDTNPIS